MSDIDFDELDKAVNTLMGGVSTTPPAKADNIKTLTIDSTIPDDSHPSLEKLDSTLSQVNGTVAPAMPKPVGPNPSSTPARPSAPSLANRRAGRFMDVVHPSNIKPGSKPASRVGATIQPAGVATMNGVKTPPAEVVSDTPPLESYGSMTVSDVAPLSEAPSLDLNENSTSTDWPDPLDMSSYDNESDTEKTGDKVTESSVIDADSAADPKQDEQEPLVSPFIADAKVEKRPLGGIPAEGPAVELPDAHAVVLDNAELNPAEDASDQLPVDPPAPDVQLPPELQSDLMAIETDGDTAPSAAVQPTPVNSVPSRQPAIDTKPAASVALAVPSGPTSIPQQYQEEPSTSDVSNGSIYDTDSYHQPIAHPAKTKSGWLWIIWILLLLLVGGGGAVALYFVGII